MNAAIRRTRTLRSAAIGDLVLRVSLAPVTRTQLVYYCAAAGVTDPIHFDVKTATAHGFPDLVVNGSLRIAWLVEAASELAVRPSVLESITCQHRSPMFVGQAAQISVTVTQRVEAEAEGERIELTIRNEVDGKVADVGVAWIVIPRKRRAASTARR